MDYGPRTVRGAAATLQPAEDAIETPKPDSEKRPKIDAELGRSADQDVLSVFSPKWHGVWRSRGQEVRKSGSHEVLDDTMSVRE